MNKFDLVTVYEDPITCNKVEGTALLIHPHKRGRLDGCELWEVKFKGENYTYARQINVENH